MSKISYVGSKVVVAILVAFLFAPNLRAEVRKTDGLPVDGEIPGVVLELHSDEAGLSEVYFVSDFDDIGVLVLTNGDPMLGANDLEQFGGVLSDGLSCQGQVILNVSNGNLSGASIAAREGNIVCCILPNCSMKSRRSCARKGGVTGMGGVPFTSFKDCVDRCR